MNGWTDGKADKKHYLRSVVVVVDNVVAVVVVTVNITPNKVNQ